MIEAAIQKISSGVDLSMEEMADAIGLIMQGKCDEETMASLLTALCAKGEAVDEIAGAALAMRKNMVAIRTRHAQLIDTCGTGGDGSGTFNISTAAAIVTAAAGVPVAKHGNRAMTSKTGSADVLDQLGVNVAAEMNVVQRCLDELKICFCFAPLAHPAMKHVANVRRKLGVPTIFNLLGPLCNPASAPFQLLGVGKSELRPRLAAALQRLEVQRAVVVCGEDGLDEVTLSGTTRATLIANGTLHEFSWHPSDFGLQAAGTESMLVDGASESAAMIRGILDGEAGAPRDIVVLNAAAALWTAGCEQDLITCAERAATAIDSGTALDLLRRLAELSHS